MLSIQIDGKKWIDLKNCKETDKFLEARNSGKLDYVIISDNCDIIELKVGILKKKKNTNQVIIDCVNKIYRHR